MSLDKILVAIFGVMGIFLTYWYFLMKKEKEVAVKNEVDITVDGGYSPDVISVPLGKPTKINFFRKDPSNCLEDVVLGDFKIRRELPLNKKVSIQITPTKRGEFVFTCGMNMFHGKLIVR